MLKAYYVKRQRPSSPFTQSHGIPRQGLVTGCDCNFVFRCHAVKSAERVLRGASRGFPRRLCAGERRALPTKGALERHEFLEQQIQACETRIASMVDDLTPPGCRKP